jgi:hypothetical protein
MVIPSVISSVQGRKAAAARLAVLIIIVQALGLGPVWPQEPTQLRLDEEIRKQEKIFRRRGADVPRGYITNRGAANAFNRFLIFSRSWRSHTQRTPGRWD